MRLLLLSLGLLAAVPARAQSTWPVVTGRVVDAETGMPLAGVPVYHVHCEAADRPETCIPSELSLRYPAGRTNSTGQFEIWTGQMGIQAHTTWVRGAGYCDAVTPPFDEAARFRLSRRLQERLNAPVTRRTDLAEEQRQGLWRENNRLVDDLFPIQHVEIALHRPPCSSE